MPLRASVIILLSAACICATVAGMATGTAHAAACLDNGVCWSSSRVGPVGSGDREVTLSGQPRVLGDYVVLHYNVRVTGDFRRHPDQFERTVGQYRNSFVTSAGVTVAVQGCRKRLLRSYCTRWSSFVVP
jgi:hypothetical protein